VAVFFVSFVDFVKPGFFLQKRLKNIPLRVCLAEKLVHLNEGFLL